MAIFIGQLLLAFSASADPPFLHTSLAAAVEKKADLTTSTCHYKPLFENRFGEAVVDANGSCASVQYPEEDQVYVVLEGRGSVKYGSTDVRLRKEDYLYLPATVPHVLSNNFGGELKVAVMRFRTKGFEKAPLPKSPLKANIEDVPTQSVSGHPAETLYRLLMGDLNSKRDRIAAGRVLTSLFLMEIPPGGTNTPHHHEREEEIYLVLDGHGEMVAGGGMDGIEGRHPAGPGDAYYFRMNCTVGYYSAPNVKSRILAVRYWHPGMVLSGMQH